MKVYITVILLCLNKFHIWENSGPWDMTQNVLGQSDSEIFQSIARVFFSRKTRFWSKFGQKGPEWAQNMVFGIFWKFRHVSFSWK